MTVRLDTGILVAFEGIDGAGKTTQAALLEDRLSRRGLAILRTKEPTSGVHGQMLRNSATQGRLDVARELELFVADRREHVEKLIRPALSDGAIVIIDRYYFSNAAYQGARGMNPIDIIKTNEEFAPIPDLLVLLRITPECAQVRISSRGDGSGNLFEQADQLRRAAEIFDRIDRDYLLRVDGEQPRQVIHDRIMKALDAGPLSRRREVPTDPVG